jgi:hypothetical protein
MPDKWLVIAIGVMLLAYALVFLFRGNVTRKHNKFKTDMSMAEDPSMISVGLNKKQKQFKDREAREKMADEIEKEFEAQQAAREHVYPQHKTREEWIEEEYQVGKEKETHYPERDVPKK